jgi:hypothetical protein
MRQFADAVESLLAAERGDPNRSLAHNYFFVAMARRRLGERLQAIEDFVQAAQWMQTHAPNDEELIRFRAEAAWTIFFGDSFHGPR